MTDEYAKTLEILENLIRKVVREELARATVYLPPERMVGGAPSLVDPKLISRNDPVLGEVVYTFGNLPQPVPEV